LKIADSIIKSRELAEKNKSEIQRKNGFLKRNAGIHAKNVR